MTLTEGVLSGCLRATCGRGSSSSLTMGTATWLSRATGERRGSSGRWLSVLFGCLLASALLANWSGFAHAARRCRCATNEHCDGESCLPGVSSTTPPSKPQRFCIKHSDCEWSAPVDGTSSMCCGGSCCKAKCCNHKDCEKGEVCCNAACIKGKCCVDEDCKQYKSKRVCISGQCVPYPTPPCPGDPSVPPDCSVKTSCCYSRACTKDSDCGWSAPNNPTKYRCCDWRCVETECCNHKHCNRGEVCCSSRCRKGNCCADEDCKGKKSTPACRNWRCIGR